MKYDTLINIIEKNDIDWFKSMIEEYNSSDFYTVISLVREYGIKEGKFKVGKYLIDKGYLNSDIFSDIKRIELKSYEDCDFDGIEKLFNLEYITKGNSIENNNIYNVDNLKYLTNLTEIKLNSFNIENIDFIKYLNKLNKLDLSYNNISNFSVLENCKYLKFLHINGNPVKSYAFFYELTSLFSINIDKINDYKFYKGLEYIQPRSITVIGSYGDIYEVTCNEYRNLYPVYDYTDEGYKNITLKEFQTNIKRALRRGKIQYIKNYE